MSEKNLLVINLNIFKVSFRQFIRNFLISLILLFIFVLSLLYFTNQSFTYTLNYKVKINDYEYDKFLKKYEIINSNLFGESFYDFISSRDGNSIIYERTFLLDELYNYLNIEINESYLTDNSYFILTGIDKGSTKASIYVNISKVFSQNYFEEINLLKVKEKLSETMNNIFSNSKNRINIIVDQYQQELFELYKIKRIQDFENVRSDIAEENIISTESRDAFMLKLIMSLMFSPNKDNESIEDSLNKSDIYVKILDQLKDLSIGDVEELDSKVLMISEQRIKQIRNLQYEENKVKLDFVESILIDEKIPNLNFFSVKFIFLSFLFLIISNIIIAIFSKKTL
tara:strand:+ start:37549 stop:38571 length:1023 start_codon:yes stop_codon:yes gene_type:complete